MNRTARELLSDLRSGPCRCTVTVPSGMVSFCPTTRKTQFHAKPQQPVDCLACRARRALEEEDRHTREP